MNTASSTKPASPSALNSVAEVRLTLAIPYYAGFELLLRTLGSIAAQRSDAFGVLIVDDSPQGLLAAETAAIRDALHPHSAQFLRNERNLGMALTWNRCIDEAATDLVTIVHGDDELERDYVREMIALADAQPSAAAVFCGARIISESGTSSFSFPDAYKRLIVPAHHDVLSLKGDSAVQSLLRGNYIFCPTLCYRRSQLGPHRFDPRYRMVPDLDMLTRLFLDGREVVGIPKRVLYRYRRHSSNATQHLTKELTRFTEECSFYSDIEQRAANAGFTQSVRVARGRAVIRNNLLFCVARDFAHLNLADGVQKLRLFQKLFLSPRSSSSR